jgi:hypothetical protein
MRNEVRSHGMTSDASPRNGVSLFVIPFVIALLIGLRWIRALLLK